MGEDFMVVKARKKGNKWRLYEGPKLAVSKHGRPVDGGGHTDKGKAERQANHINAKPRRNSNVK